MLTPRRFVPSLSLLLAFEAAARTGSITSAAKEVRLTQSAVSRQIKALEEQLDVKLFVRDRQTVRLTLAGESYAKEIREALRRISTASLNLRANPCGGTLNLAATATFGERWLAARIPNFARANPEVAVNLLTHSGLIDFRQESFDAVIHTSAGASGGECTALLRQETVMPLCSPAFRGKYHFQKPQDLTKATLLHLTTRPDAWERWFLLNNFDPKSVHGPLFDQFSTMAQAAAAGFGVALLPDFLFSREIEERSLVPALNLPMQTGNDYMLTWPSDRAAYVPLLVFRDWIVDQMREQKLLSE